MMEKMPKEIIQKQRKLAEDALDAMIELNAYGFYETDRYRDIINRLRVDVSAAQDALE